MNVTLSNLFDDWKWKKVFSGFSYRMWRAIKFLCKTDLSYFFNEHVKIDFFL